MREDLKILISILAGFLACLGIMAPSFYWVFHVLVPVLRGTAGDWLLLISISLIVLGPSWVWYHVTKWTLERLDDRA